jgi:site-specific DNA-methyltransferase (adenine-specific)
MILHGDCLEQSEQIQSGSVDLILTDPPYGNMKGINETFAGYGRKNDDGHLWDNAIDPKDIFSIANRILRKNGKLILFSQEPYTSQLITNAIPNVPFSYRMIWEKDNFANALLSKKAPVSYFEDILVFSKTHTKHDFEGLHPLREYFKQVMDFIGLNKKTIIEIIGQKADHVLRVDSTQFSLCTEPTYNELIEHFNIDKMQGFKNFAELKPIDKEYRTELIERMTREAPHTFNLWEGKKYKSNVLKYKKDYNGYHPTQKPISLLEDLIKTYSNETDLVVDLTCGSGSTAVAAINTKRRYIAIEKELKYYEIAKDRVNRANSEIKLF